MVHVLIEREIAKGMVSTYEQQLRNALQQSYVVHGFISGEAFTDIKDEHHRFLLCKWRSIQDWNRWCHSDERAALMNTIRPILVREETVSVLEN